MQNRSVKRSIWLATAVMVTEMGMAASANAAENPFQMTELPGGYQLAHQDQHEEEKKEVVVTNEAAKETEMEKEHKTEEKKTGAEGKCGTEHMKLYEGKCGGH